MIADNNQLSADSVFAGESAVGEGRRHMHVFAVHRKRTVFCLPTLESVRRDVDIQAHIDYLSFYPLAEFVLSVTACQSNPESVHGIHILINSFRVEIFCYIHNFLLEIDTEYRYKYIDILDCNTFVRYVNAQQKRRMDFANEQQKREDQNCEFIRLDIQKKLDIIVRSFFWCYIFMDFVYSVASLISMRVFGISRMRKYCIVNVNPTEQNT